MADLGELSPRLPSPVARLDDTRLDDTGVEVWLKRDDLIGDQLPGNKWRKLRHNLRRLSPNDSILTFGGAYSNHLRAVAAAGAMLDIATIGVVRGEEHEPLNWSLRQAAGHGMTLTYMDRGTYRRKHTAPVLAKLRRQFGDVTVIPEGGSNPAGVRGCADLGAELHQQLAADIVCVPCGTGGTLAGIAAATPPRQRVWGFAALKGGAYLRDEVAALQLRTFGARRGHWDIIDEFHHGGFARSTATLTAFTRDFARRHGIRLESVYVAKMMHGVFTLITRGAVAPGTRVAVVITGPAEREQA